MDEYQTPVSNIVSHADSLVAASVDLTDKRLTELSTSENDAQSATEKIRTDDCAQVAAMIKAVELRPEPVQCELEPLLPDAAGSACGGGFKNTGVFDAGRESVVVGQRVVVRVDLGCRRHTKKKNKKTIQT